MFKKNHIRNAAGVMAAVFLTVICQMFAPAADALSFDPGFEVSSQGVYLANLDKDTLIYEKNAQEQYCPASLVKIMTAIVALENCSDLNIKVTAPIEVFNELYGRNASNAGMSAGEEMTMQDLLYGLMLKSGCDSAGTIADYISGGETGRFVDMMNAKAKEIGAENTVFVDAHGLDNDTQRTTAYDMYLITKYALSIPKFKEIATAYSYTLPPTNKRGEEDTTRYWTHTNQMMNSKSKYYNQYVKGIKTGTSGLNTKNLVTMAQKDGNTYLLILLGAPSRDAEGNTLQSTFEDSNKLYQWIFKDFSMRSLVDTKEYLEEVPVKLSAEKDYVLGVPEEDALAFLPNNVDLKNDIKKVATVKKDVMAPLKKGDVVGSVELQLQGETLATVNLVASENVDRSTWKYFGYQMQRFFRNRWVQFILVLLLLLLVSYIVLAVVYNHRKKKRRQRKAQPASQDREE